jgi:CheY-like chemotaxis protein
MSSKRTATVEENVHNLNEQLQIIRSSVEHLIMRMEISQDEKNYFDKIIDSVDRCSDILTQNMIKTNSKKIDVHASGVLKKKGAKILIIEDEKDIAEIYSSNLEYFGFKTHVATNFIDGMHIINTEEVAIVILDVMLPDAYGLDCVDVILAKNKDIKIVVVTGKLDELRQDLSHLEGKCTILTKPFSIRALLAAVL